MINRVLLICCRFSPGAFTHALQSPAYLCVS